MALSAQATSLSGDVIIIGAPTDGAHADLENNLKAAGARLHSCTSFEETYRTARETRPFAALAYLDETPQTSLMDALEGALRARPALRIIGLTSQDPAMASRFLRLVREGLLHDFHTLPLRPDILLFMLGHVRAMAMLESDGAAPDRTTAMESEPYMVGSSRAMLDTYRAIRKVAGTDAPVLITGESGTGKELAARAIHERSSNSKGPFVAINCAGLPASLIASELFGHERGAFTGAVARKLGRLEAAKNGTCFLDEIGDLPIELQGHLLRFLQEKVIERVGSTQSIPLDVRIIAATNVDLQQAVKEGRFREDLFYRLNVLSIHMPPLRAREDDIELLARFFLQKFAHELGRPVAGLRESALAAMRNHSWPGNVRELISVIRRAVVMADRRWLSAADLGMSTPHTLRLNRASVPTLAEARREAEVTCIRQAMEASSLNIQSAARNLGVSRVTLYRLLEKYSIMPIKESGMNHGPDTQEGQTETQIRGSAS